MITLEANPSDAPCCVKIINHDGRDLLVQTDYDFPATASAFGWSVAQVPAPGGQACGHTGTDGTIACPGCHLAAIEFITAARQWIDDNDGAQAEDPGYFAD